MDTFHQNCINFKQLSSIPQNSSQHACCIVCFAFACSQDFPQPFQPYPAFSSVNQQNQNDHINLSHPYHDSFSHPQYQQNKNDEI